MGNRHRGVLLFAAGIGETEVNKLDFVFYLVHTAAFMPKTRLQTILLKRSILP
jgi:hypothetical protein